MGRPLPGAGDSDQRTASWGEAQIAHARNVENVLEGRGVAGVGVPRVRDGDRNLYRAGC